MNKLKYKGKVKDACISINGKVYRANDDIALDSLEGVSISKNWEIAKDKAVEQVDKNLEALKEGKVVDLDKEEKKVGKTK